MNANYIHLRSLHLAAILAIVIVTGCAQSYKIGLVKPDKSSSQHEFISGNYKVNLVITPIAEGNEFVCSIQLFNKGDNSTVKEIEADMNITRDRISQINSKMRGSIRHNYIGGIISTLNTSTMKYEFKYELKSKGKYDMNIEVSKIDGEILDKDILISFEQEVK